MRSRLPETDVRSKPTEARKYWGLGWLLSQFTRESNTATANDGESNTTSANNGESNTTTALLDLISMFFDDLALAEDLQAEEVLRFSTPSRRSCAVCKQVIPSLDASWKPDNCDHVICIACFSQYAPETEATRLPRCAVASCGSLCKSETPQGFNACYGTLISIEDMDKGKRPLDAMLQEFGQCSSGSDAMTSSEFYCTICMETVHVRELFPVAGCTHTFCVSCVGQYVATKVEENVLSIGCPDPGCKNGVLHPEECRDVIPLQVFQRWGSALCDSTSSEFYCTICMETVHVRELFPIAGCTHTFCVGCVGQYVAAKVEENVLSIGCPDPGCKDGVLHPEECRDVIPLQVFQRWGSALCDSALGSLKFYCPFKDCSALLVDDHGHNEAAITKAECPHCSRMFCAQCKVAWHDGFTCTEFQRLGKDERGKDDLLLRKVAQTSKWQRCPKCKMYVERAEGCVYIVCRCRHCFCYLCGSPMTRGNHHCSRCKRTW